MDFASACEEFVYFRPPRPGQNRMSRSSVEPFTRQRRLKAPITNRGEKMRQPLRHIEDTVTSVVVLLVFGAMAMGFFGLVVLMLALGF